MSAAFPATARVLTSAEFEHVFKHGKRTAAPSMALHLLPGGDGARLGLVVSRKVDKRAVGRNRIKRVIRETFRHCRQALPPGAYVVLARNGAAACDNAALGHTLGQLMRRAGVLPPSSSPLFPTSTPA